jgi:hypothetical protein
MWELDLSEGDALPGREKKRTKRTTSAGTPPRKSEMKNENTLKWLF